MWRKFIIISILIISADQVTKLLADKYLASSESLPVIGNSFRLTLVKNPYGLWGIKVPIISPAIVGICIVIVGFVFYKTKLLQLALIFGGAIGNFIDRLRIGAVIDFLDFGVGKFRWPVFNIADAGITIGVLLLIIKGITDKRR